MTERLIISVLTGTIGAGLVWTISIVGHAPCVWPGTILMFAMNTLSTFVLLRNRDRRGRR